MTYKDLNNFFRKAIEPIWRSVQLLVGKAVLEAVQDSKGIQVVKVSLLANETQTMERYQDYGFTSVPEQDAEGIAIFVGGNRENGVVVRMDDRKWRLKNLASGEVAMYHKSGSKVHLKANGDIEVFGEKVKLGDGTLEKALKGEAFQTLFNNHVHTGNLGVPTSPPTVPSTPAELSTILETT